MTKLQAHIEAHRRWGTPGISPGDRYGAVTLRQKKVKDRCEVGYHIRGGRAASGMLMHQFVVMGHGPTWEIAFADAFRTEQRP